MHSTTPNSYPTLSLSSRNIMLMYFGLAASATFIASLYASLRQTRQEEAATKLEFCVDRMLPNTPHKIRADRVLVVDKQDNIITRIGLLPTVPDNQLTPALVPLAPQLREQCGRLSETYIKTKRQL